MDSKQHYASENGGEMRRTLIPFNCRGFTPNLQYKRVALKPRENRFSCVVKELRGEIIHRRLVQGEKNAHG